LIGRLIELCCPATSTSSSLYALYSVLYVWANVTDDKH